MPCDFTPEEVEKLFGAEAAEQEDPQRLRKYFFKSKTYEDVRADLPLRILVGHKGIGKSAMFRICYGEDIDRKNLSLFVRPDDLLDLKFDETTNINLLIKNWKDGLITLIMTKILSFVGDGPDQIVARNLAKVGSVFVKSLMAYFSEKLKGPLDPLVKATLAKFSTTQKIFIYIDDLDRGWEGKAIDIRRVSALLNALRDMSTDFPGLYFRVALRADVYFLVRTSDELTDKIESSVIWYTWTNHEIFKILVKRVSTFFGRNLDERQLGGMLQHQMSKILDEIMEPRFSGKGHWENAPMYKVLLSLVRKRPRDLIKLCSEAAKSARARGSKIITAQDLKAIFENYSQGRLQDTINEYKTELPDIKRLLFGMKPSTREMKAATGYQYTTAELLSKITSIQQSGKFVFTSGTLASKKELQAFMYKINFITARKKTNTGEIDRKYFEESRYIASEVTEFGYDWEVHPAYRWALQPASVGEIIDALSLTTIEF